MFEFLLADVPQIIPVGNGIPAVSGSIYGVEHRPKKSVLVSLASLADKQIEHHLPKPVGSVPVDATFVAT
eukprot:scaffold154996_cov44-Attheya_sp.AAC.1